MARTIKNHRTNNPNTKVVKDLVVIDQKKIRKKYITNCKKTIKELEKVKNSWEEYHSNDIPQYEAWYNQTFGSKLSEIRENQEKASYLYHQIYEIKYWSRKKRISEFEAYLHILDRKRNPEKYFEEDEAERKKEEEFYKNQEKNRKQNHDSYNFEEDDEDEDNEFIFSDEDLEEMFQMFLNANRDLKQKAKDPKIYKEYFENFKKEYYKQFPENKQPPPRLSKEDEMLRIKKLYRELARKLHPDYQKENNPFYNELWNDVQKAYQDQDLEKLETLLALSNIHSGDFSFEISISDLIKVQQEYKNQLKSLRSEIKKYKKNIQWGFSKITNYSPIKKSIEQELRDKLKEIKNDIFNFKGYLETFEIMATKKPMRKTDKRDLFFL
jgi:hypothetical protein